MEPARSDHTIRHGPERGQLLAVDRGALIAVHRAAEGQAGVQAIESYAVGNLRSYPFVVGNAGQVIQVLDSRKR